MNQSFNLFQLQKIDTQIDQIDARLKEIAALLLANEHIKVAEQKVLESKKVLEQGRQSVRKKEEEIKTLRIKKEFSEASLYGGKISNPKELKDIQNEIASINKRISGLEDLQLETMIEVEQSEKNLQADELSLAQKQADFIQQNSKLLGEQTHLKTQKDRFQSERNIPLSAISSENLAVYQKLRIQKRGIAIVRVEDGACTACGTTLRPEEIQSAKSPTQIVFCSCGRIIYSG